jgi:hypothetical protein
MKKNYIFFDKYTGVIENIRPFSESQRVIHMRLNKNLDYVENVDNVNVKSAVEGKWSVDINTKQLVFTPHPPADPAELYSHLRSKRNTLLQKTDWTQFDNSPITAERKAAFAEYRQALRDLPAQYPNMQEYEDYEDVVWPKRPS